MEFLGPAAYRRVVDAVRADRFENAFIRGILIDDRRELVRRQIETFQKALIDGRVTAEIAAEFAARFHAGFIDQAGQPADAAEFCIPVARRARRRRYGRRHRRRLRMVREAACSVVRNSRRMQRTIVPGVSMWSVWQPDRNLFFNSYFIETTDGNLAVDPLPAAAPDIDEMKSCGGVAWIVVTNRDHERDARALALRFGAKIATSATEAALLSGPVDRTLAHGESFFGARVVAIDGVKTAGEFALHFPALRAVVVGDALWGDPAGSLRLMPDEKLIDPARAVLSLRAIAACLPDHLLLGDGAPLFGNARTVLQDALEARRDAYANKINRDDVPWRVWENEPAGYGGRTLEIGDYVGAERLGYRLVEIAPGHANAPLHWHGSEEELFVVLSGGATLVSDRGEHDVRAGDYIAFRTRASGAHKIVNRTQEPCEILMVANIDAADVCYYPDSKKVLVEKTDVLVRDHPQLGYWDGE